MEEDGDLRNALITDERLVVERPIYNQLEFDRGFESSTRPKQLPHTWAKKKVSKLECSGRCVGRFLTSIFPFIGILKKYQVRKDLPQDIIAGLTVGIMHIPQGMAYGQLSTLPPIFGLYVSFFPVLIYFFFGTSKHISIGTFAVVSLMVGSVVDKGMSARGLLVPDDEDTSVKNITILNGTDNGTAPMGSDADAYRLQVKLGLAMAVTFAVGCLQLLLGICQLGFLAVYLSDPLVSGFTTGAACHVFTSQIKHIFGVKMGRYSGPLKLIWSYRDFFSNIPSTNAVTLITSILCIAILIIIKECINNNPKIKPKLKMPVPVELIVVVLGTVISYLARLGEDFNVIIVGDIPIGIPAPEAQQFTYLSGVASDAIAVGIVAFAISVSMAKILAKKHDYDIDPNQELLAYGFVNVFGSFFSTFCASASLSRSLVQEGVGGRTQVAGLFSSALMLIVLLVIGPYFKPLPNCVLASIIVVALKGMFKQFLELKRLWSISIIDFLIWLITWLATVLLDVDYGLMVGVGFALVTVIFRLQRPYACAMGNVPGTDLYRDLKVYKAAKEVAGIKIYRFDAALFFANTEHFKNTVFKLTVDPKVLKKKIRKAEKQLQNVVNKKDEDGTEPHYRKQADQLEPSTEDLDTVSKPKVTDIHTIIIDCSTISYVDSVGVKVMGQVVSEFKNVNLQVYLAQCKGDLREMFEKTGFFKTTDKEVLFVSIHDAVLSAQKSQTRINGSIPNGQSKQPSEIYTDDTNNNPGEQFEISNTGSMILSAEEEFVDVKQVNVDI